MERDARTEDLPEASRAGIEAKSQKISELEARNEELETKIAGAKYGLSY